MTQTFVNLGAHSKSWAGLETRKVEGAFRALSLSKHSHFQQDPAACRALYKKQSPSFLPLPQLSRLSNFPSRNGTKKVLFIMQQTKLYKRIATPFEILPPGTPESFLELRSLGVGKVEVVVFAERSSTTQRYELLRTTECGDKGLQITKTTLPPISNTIN